MNFRLETRAGIPTVVWDDGMCRPASGPEVELWRENERLRGALLDIVSIIGDCHMRDKWATVKARAKQALEVGDGY